MIQTWSLPIRSSFPVGREHSHQFSSVTQSCLTLCDSWTIAHQASLFITNSWSLLKLMSIESVIPSNHLILCHPLLLLPSIFPSIRIFSNESALLIRWPKYWSFSFNTSPSNEYSGLISFRMDWFKIGKGVHQGYILSPCLFNLYAEFSSVTQLFLTLCDPRDSSMPGFPVHHQLPEIAQIHVLRASDAIQPSHPLSSPSPPAFNLSQYQGLFQ